MIATLPRREQAPPRWCSAVARGARGRVVQRANRPSEGQVYTYPELAIKDTIVHERCGRDLRSSRTFGLVPSLVPTPSSHCTFTEERHHQPPWRPRNSSSGRCHVLLAPARCTIGDAAWSERSCELPCCPGDGIPIEDVLGKLGGRVQGTFVAATASAPNFLLLSLICARRCAEVPCVLPAGTP